MDDEVRDYYFPSDDDLDAAIEAAKPYVYPSRAQLKEAITHANRTAKRQPHVLGTRAHPSRWDDAHSFIDDLLNDLEGR